MHTLAKTLLALGEWAKARVLQEEVLAARRRLFSGEHPAPLTAMHSLAET